MVDIHARSSKSKASNAFDTIGRGARTPFHTRGILTLRNRSEAAIPVILSSAGSGGLCKEVGECEGAGAVLCSAVCAVDIRVACSRRCCTPATARSLTCNSSLSGRMHPCAGTPGCLPRAWGALISIYSPLHLLSALPDFSLCCVCHIYLTGPGGNPRCGDVVLCSAGGWRCMQRAWQVSMSWSNLLLHCGRNARDARAACIRTCCAAAGTVPYLYRRKKVQKDLGEAHGLLQRFTDW